MKTPTLKTIQHAGEYGNFAVATGKVEFEGDSAGTAGGVFNLPPMTELIEVDLINEAMGGSTTLAVNAVGASGTTAVLAAASSTTAGKRTTTFAPFVLTEATEVQVALAGGAGTGVASVVAKYKYIGA